MAPHAEYDPLYSFVEPESSYQSSEISYEEEQSKSSESSFPEAPLDEEAQTHPFRDDIAIVGMACRLPGGATSPSKLWDLLANERSGQCEVPKSRFDIDSFYHPRGNDRPGSMHMRGGYFLKDEDIRGFENDFFGINNLEAMYMDPQQRKLLEVVFECFESAGLPLSKASGSNIGCYVGNFTVDFQLMQLRDAEYLHRYTATGMGTTILGNRISHAFNLQGPSLVIDTACSSSLYCLHVACAALKNKECDGAIVAGANLIQTPEQHLATMKAGVLSPTSTCHTFDASADGYGRADGIGALYVKKLSAAIRDGDPIRSIIRGSAINANGKTQGITLPSILGQEAVIRKAYNEAALPTNQTAYVECHGTGTAVGDPIEVESVSKVFGKSIGPPMLIGSVKSNLGHSEAASGISSIIKGTLALENECIPATIGLKKLNPKIKSHEWNVQVVSKARAWPLTEYNGIKRMGVNSFGYGGANAHVILESGTRSRQPAPQSLPSDCTGRTTFLLPLSGSSQAALEARINDLAEYELKDFAFSDLAYTLGERRSHLQKRGFLVSNKNNLKSRLSGGQLRTLGLDVSSSPGNYAFVFTGQGAQWPQMGNELFAEFAVFRAAMAEMDAVLKCLPHAPSWNFQDAMMETAETSQINEVTHSQPVCTALQIALVLLLASWDITPSAVLGHSSGEIAAAFAAGHLSLGQAIIAAYYRGYVVGKQSSQGAMMAVGMSSELADEEISNASLQGKVCVACINSPESVTVSGDEPAIDTLLGRFQARKLFARKLKTGGRAYHSHHMVAIGQEYEDLVTAGFKTLDPSFNLSKGPLFISSVNGRANDHKLGPSYWRSNLESPVRFYNAVTQLTKEGSYHLVELGPHAALELPIKQTRTKLNISEESLPYSAAISRGKNSVETVLALAGLLWLYGNEIKFGKINYPEFDLAQGKPRPLRVVHDLPAYRWTYDTLLWNEPRESIEFRHRKYPRHEILGSRITAGSGADFSWRNVLRIGDAPWLEDHKLEETVVFPGGGYLAMAAEAVSQATEKPWSPGTSLELQNIHILSALMIPTAVSAQVEIFTTLRPTPNTKASNSEVWWDFTISSYSQKASDVHATGSIRMDSSPTQELSPKYQMPDSLLEPSASRIWYERFINEGLNYGKSFQSIEAVFAPRLRSQKCCRTKVKLLQNSPGDATAGPDYPIHPITIDAMIQSGIVATAAGHTRDLQAFVPTRITKAIFKVPTIEETEVWHINAQASKLGVSSAGFDAELLNQRDEVAAQIEFGRLNHYEAMAISEESEIERHPMLRVAWKPDVYGPELMRAADFTNYLNQFVAEAHSPVSDEGMLKLGAALNLLTHKNPRMRILELGSNEPAFSKAVLALLFSDSDYKRLQSYSTGYMDDEGFIRGTSWDLRNVTANRLENLPVIENEQFDLIMLPAKASADRHMEDQAPLKRLLSSDGLILSLSTRTSELAIEGIESVVSPLSDGNGYISLARPSVQPDLSRVTRDKPVVLIEQRENALGETLQDLITQTASDVQRILLSDVTQTSVPRGTVVISLLEAEEPLLSNISDEQMDHLKVITDNASTLLWITAGDILNGRRPDFALVSGLSRALMLEQPSLRFLTFDVDDIHGNTCRTAENVIKVLESIHRPLSDSEYVESKGVVHVSRFVPDNDLNASFRRKQGSETLAATLGSVKPVQLAIARPGQFDSVYFKQISIPQDLNDQDVQVDVKAVGMNAKDLYVLGGKVDTKDASCTLEYSGVVEKVGLGVTDIKRGDRVVVMAPGHFKTTEIVPQWACKKLRDDEDFTTICTLPLVYSTAIYALQHRARLQKGETVLIHSGAGGVGIAAIEIAQMAGAEVYTTVSTEEKKDYLIKRFGLKASNIFSSRDTSFEESVLKATNGNGVDVVLNSLTGDFLHASWRCCAPFGRFIEIGKRDLIDDGKLEMNGFLKNLTFSAFDLSNIYLDGGAACQKLWTDLLDQVLKLYRAKKISKIAQVEKFDISQVSNALRRFLSRNRIGKIAVSLEDTEANINVQTFKYKSSFNPAKVYIMVGCLGGLGRSMAKWMMARGARKFAFLGRSGADKPSARRLIEDLTSNGAQCEVVRGDVCNMQDVQNLVSRADGVIGGVIQAAMGLNEALFTVMSNKFWHTGIDPKVQGSWNLHKAIQGRDSELDFFFMTSSVSGSVGTATEANYCAGNHFLDHFARYRRSQGLPALAIGLGMISEVGYLHDNPEIEALLVRKGIQAINEDELLQIVDIALSTPMSIPHICDSAAAAHVLTGLEPFGLLALRKKGFDGTNITFNDPRAGILASALDGTNANSATATSADGDLPAEIIKAVEGGSALSDAVYAHIAAKLGNLVLVPVDKIPPKKSLSEYGMDSMIAAEFRTWFFQAFKVDVPFLELLSKTMTAKGLSDMIVAEIEARG